MIDKSRYPFVRVMFYGVLHTVTLGASLTGYFCTGLIWMLVVAGICAVLSVWAYAELAAVAIEGQRR